MRLKLGVKNLIKTNKIEFIIADNPSDSKKYLKTKIYSTEILYRGKNLTINFPKDNLSIFCEISGHLIFINSEISIEQIKFNNSNIEEVSIETVARLITDENKLEIKFYKDIEENSNTFVYYRDKNCFGDESIDKIIIP